jgi:hypothetical protein
VQQLLHVLDVAGDAPRLKSQAIAKDRARVGAHALGPQHRAHLDIPLEISPRDRFVPRLLAKESAQFPMRCERAVNHHSGIVRLFTQLMKKLVGQLIQLKMRAELHVPNVFVRQQAKQPRMRIAVLDRIGFHPQSQLKLAGHAWSFHPDSRAPT